MKHIGRKWATAQTWAGGRHARLLRGTALGCSIAVMAGLAPGLALAADVCGTFVKAATPGVDTANCTAVSGAGNPYSGGIAYVEASSGAPTDDLTVTLGGGASAVAIDTSASPGTVSVVVIGAPDHNATLVAAAGSSITAAGIGAFVTTSGAGAVSVQSAATIQTSAYGLYAGADGAVSVVNTGAISVSGPNRSAIDATSTAGAVTVSNSGAVTVTATNTTGINAVSQGGGAVAVINSGAIRTTGNGSTGVYASSNTGNVAITNAVGALVQTDGINNAGLAAISNTGSASIVNHGQIATLSTQPSVNFNIGAIAQSASGAASVVNDGAVSVAGPGAVALMAVASATGGSASVTNTGGAVTASGAEAGGIVAEAQGQVNVTTGAVTVTSTAAGGEAGVFAASLAGGASVVIDGPVAVAGVGYGVQTQAARQETVSGSGAVTVAGVNSVGIGALSTAGAANVVLTGAISTLGAGSTAVRSSAAGSSSVTVSTVRSGGDGVQNTASGGAGLVTLAGGGIIQAAGDGIDNTATGGVAQVTVAANGQVVASDIGVNNTANSGGAVVEVDGAVTSGGAEAVANFGRGGPASVTVSGGVVATAGIGISNEGQQGTGSVIVASTGVVIAAGDGISTFIAGADATVQVNGVVRSVTSGDGVYAASNGFSATVTVGAGGVVSAVDGAGVAAEDNYAPVTVTVAAGGSVTNTGVGDAIDASTFSAYGGAATVTNSGVVASQAGAGASVISSADAASLTNTASGSLRGSVFVQGATSASFVNAGTWLAERTSTFGGATTHLTNSGLIQVASASTTPATVEIVGLQRFDNSGTISLQGANAHTGDVFSLGGAAFNASGASTLNIDATLRATLTTDQLTVGAVTGQTTVNVRDLATTQSAVINLAGVTVVQGISGAPGAFTLAGGVLHKGWVGYALRQTAAAGGLVDWNLVGLPAHAVFETLKLPQLGLDLADHAGDAFTTQMQDGRDAAGHDARPDGAQVWVQLLGGSRDRSQTTSFTLAPATTLAESLSTASRWGEVEAGIDNQTSLDGGSLLLGAMVGYADQSTRFAGSPDRVGMTAANVGVYLAWRQPRGFFVDGLVKGDFLSLTSALHSVPTTIASQGDVVSAQAEAGYRFTIGAAYLEPVARLRAGRIQLDDLVGADGDAHFDDASRLQGAAGARFGTAWTQAGGLDANVSLGVYAVSDLTGHAAETFTTAPTAVSLNDSLSRTHGAIDLGLNVKTHGGAQGFVKASADFGGGLTGWTAGAGLRWAF